MAVVRTIQSDTTQVAFGGRPLLTAVIVEIAFTNAGGDYTNGAGLPLTPAQVGLSSIFHAIGYVKTVAATGFFPIWDATLGAFRIMGGSAASQGVFNEIATNSAALAANNTLVAIVFGF